jgi:hypothetical protein
MSCYYKLPELMSLISVIRVEWRQHREFHLFMENAESSKSDFRLNALTSCLNDD